MATVMAVLSTIWRDNVGLDRLLYIFYAVYWQIRKRLGISFVATLANGAKVQVLPVSLFSCLFYSRWQERKDLMFIRANSNLAKTFVDVGANVGLFSAQLFDKFSAFYLFEPDSTSYRALLASCGLNPGVRWIAQNVAVSDRTGVGSFFHAGDYSVTGRLVPSDYPSSPNIQSVLTVTLDEALKDVVGNMIVKIDVEGSEERVFAGSRALFKTQRIKLVMFERLGRTNLDNIMGFLEEHDYVLFYVKEDGLLTRDDSFIRRPLINLFACPRLIFPTVRVGV